MNLNYLGWNSFFTENFEQYWFMFEQAHTWRLGVDPFRRSLVPKDKGPPSGDIVLTSVSFPVIHCFPNMKGGGIIKRLAQYFRSLQSGQSSYSMIYEDPIYWNNDVAYYIERTHKLTQDKPCIIIKIPFDRLGLDEKMDQVVLSDFALREWVDHIDALNELIYLCFSREHPWL